MQRLTTFTRNYAKVENRNYFFSIRNNRLIMVVYLVQYALINYDVNVSKEITRISYFPRHNIGNYNKHSLTTVTNKSL